MSRRRVLAFAATVVTVVLADQVTKAVVRSSFEIGESVPIIDGVFWLTRVRNTGAAFGVLDGWQWLLALTAFLVLGVVAWVLLRLRPQSAAARLGLALVSSGAIGNLIDRVVLGGVTDFFDLGWWPVFNVADIALDVGVALIVGWLLFSPEHRAADGHPTSAVALPRGTGDSPGGAGASAE